ncbi:unnamed protein product, partial [marine sediment metagenome]
IPKVKEIASTCKSLSIGIFRLPDPSIDIDCLRALDKRMQGLTGILDAWMTVPYNPLLNEPEAYRLEKNVFRYGVKGIAELVSIPGEINIDISDLRSVLNNAGTTYMSIGTGYGESGWIQAVTGASSNAFLDTSSPQGARRILCKVISGYHLSLKVVNDIVHDIKQMGADEAEVIFGVALDSSHGQVTKIILVATDICS